MISLLLRQSEAGDRPRLPGFVARRYFGPTFDRLLAGGVIEELEPAESWSVCPDCDCGLDARPIVERAGLLSPVCPFNADADTRLDADDCRVFRVHEDRLVALIAGASAPLPQPIPGLWHLGRALVGHELFLALRRNVLADPALTAVIVAQAQGRAALLSPCLPADQAVRVRAAGIRTLPVADVISDVGTLGARLDDARMIQLIRGGPARLEVRVAEKMVLIDGRHQHVPERPFELLRELTERAWSRGGPINNQTFAANTGRVPADVMRELKNALTKGRANAPEIRSWFTIHRTTGGYELVLDRNQIELLP